MLPGIPALLGLLGLLGTLALLVCLGAVPSYLMHLEIPVSLTTIAGGLVGLPGFIGFGNSAPGLTALGATIDLTGTSGLSLLNFAYSIPRAGTITAIDASF